MKPLNRFSYVDTISGVLQSLHVSSTLYCRSELSAPWGFAVEASSIAKFHIVTSGECLLRIEDVSDPLRLNSGDMVILPDGRSHELREGLKGPVPYLEEVLLENPVDANRCMSYGGNGATTTLICGGFLIDTYDIHPLMSAMPPFIHIQGDGRKPVAWLEASLGLLEAEMTSGSPGSEAIVNRLTDVILTQAVRGVLNGLHDGKVQGIGALNDAEISMAVNLIHRQPERPWTVIELASLVGMSRSSFSPRFRELTGFTPIRYLTQYRLTNAAHHLRADNASLAEVAQRNGYTSEVSFSKAFKRHFGVAPGAYRKRGHNEVAEIPLPVATSAD